MNKNDKQKKEQEKQEPEEKPEFLDTIRDVILKPSACAEFRQKPFKKTLSFIALVILAVSFIYTANLAFSAFRMLDSLAEFYSANLPNIRIEDGKAKVLDRINMPYKVNYEDPSGSIPLIIDTTGRMTNLNNSEKGILLTEKEVLFKYPGAVSPSGQQQSMRAINDRMSLEQFRGKTFTLNADYIREQKKSLLQSMFPVVMMLWFIYKIIMVAFQVLVFSLLTLYLNKIWNLGMKYAEMIPILIHAVIPGLLIATLIDIATIPKILAQVVSPVGAKLMLTALYYFIYTTYIYLAMKSQKGLSAENQPQPEIKE